MFSTYNTSYVYGLSLSKQLVLIIVRDQGGIFKLDFLIYYILCIFFFFLF